MKICRKCKVEKTRNEFGKDVRATDGRQSVCYVCYRGVDKDRYVRNKEVHKTRQREYMKNLDSQVKYERRRRVFLRTEHGITLEQFELMVQKQNGLCAICQKPPCSKKKVLQVDHCHKTDEIRGLLCNECNTAIGRLGDNEEGLLRALDYLRNPTVPDTLGPRSRTPAKQS